VDGIERFHCPSEFRDVPPMLLQVLERLRGIVECRVGELRQRILQIFG